ncbi:MAG: hypothetical protein IPJ65_05015 [Archangiaceae bacterium]|nr:hypothetical protein [Archangiaceae bacterium]
MAYDYRNSLVFTVRAGHELFFYLPGTRRLQPWVGLGSGIEYKDRVSTEQWSLDLAVAQTGVDVVVSPRVSVGLFASATATFVSYPRVLLGGSTRPDAQGEWAGGFTFVGSRLTAGLRGTFLAL